MKLFTAGMLTETSDLTPISTTAQDWLIEHPIDEKVKPSFQRKMLMLFSNMAREKGWNVSESICATAFPPAGRTVSAVYEHIRSTILEDLKKAMPIDGILLQLHGAAIAHGYDDCEGDLLEHIRAITGPDVPIGIELDPHCHLTERMMRNSTLMVFYKTFLHTDIEDRAIELFNLMADTLEGKIKPVKAMFDCKMIGLFDEAFEPMKSFLASVIEKEKTAGILSISPVHGFPMADVPDMGSKMLVITDTNLQLAENTAKELGREFYTARVLRNENYMDIDTALNEAEKKSGNGARAIKLVEWSDHPGCGFSSDGTELLQAMLARGMTNLVVGFIWDAVAVSICHTAGSGAELMLRIGGKISALSGTPVDLDVTIERVDQNVVINTWAGDVQLGDVAVVRCGETQLVLTSERGMFYGLQAFRDLGIEPDEKQYLLFKYLYDADDAINVMGSTFDYKNWPFTRISRPKWPWDENPFDSL